MTMLAHSTAQHETPEIIEFAPDMLVVRDIDISDPANDGSVSRFSDETWYLSPAARKPTSRTRVYFGSSPSQFRDALKRLVYCAVNLDTPMGEVGRPPGTVVRLSPGTVDDSFVSSWRPFVRWLAEQGIGSISEADADVLINYREHVAELPISLAYKDRRMLGLWRMWRYAPCLPAGDRLMQPPWEDADYEDDISGWDSRRESRSENRTRPIHPRDDVCVARVEHALRRRLPAATFCGPGSDTPTWTPISGSVSATATESGGIAIWTACDAPANPYRGSSTWAISDSLGTISRQHSTSA